MNRFAFLGRVKGGCEAEYRKRHDHIWPEVVKAYKDAGISNMTIFMSGKDVFGYFEVNEKLYERERNNLRRNPIEMEWQKYLSEITDRTELIGTPVEVFHLE
jgi:L-rhamnose mutarotase